MEPKRRLSAVWFADIVGYTTLSQTDEPAALKLVELLQAHSREIVTAHDGRIVKLMGDAVLAEFSSTDSAVRAAVALQERYVADAQGMGTPSMLRVGVHLGEVTAASDGDLYGDGINTAARLHHEAVPGQVIISEDVWRQLRQRPEFRFASLGAVELRGITAKLEIYDVLFGSRAALGARTATAPAAARPVAARGMTMVLAAVAVVAALGVAAFLLFKPDAVDENAPATQAAAPNVTPPPQPEAAAQPSGAANTPPPSSTAPKTSAPSKPTGTQATPPPVTEPRVTSPPPPVTPAPSAAVPSPAAARDRDGVRALLEQFAAALNSATPSESVAALGPGATLMSRRGTQEIRTFFGDGFEARLGRIEPVATRADEIDLRFILLAKSTTKPQVTPLVFLATVARTADAYRFTQLRRDAPGRRGRG